ncbi:Rossmann fold domain-containing protein [Tsuneonella mangrovi]|uniref:Rossmann fold domain-containing protein n=1 Tax=Tsuneonella mangrovi TaxID=1982042 RepID=UPI000BA1FE34|nr:hypothetical protein [Tsuneonella mangrovi]
MPQAVLRIDTLPEGALAAASRFHAEWLPRVLAAIANAEDGLVIVMPPAAYDHRDWRLAAVRDLARKAAPKRVNLVAGGSGEALAEALAYLDRAPGVTGQYLPLISKGDSHAGGIAAG